MGNILEMRNISKSFHGVSVLDHVNLDIRHGEVHVLLGENGAGKSTTIKILSGAYKREQGEIFFNGEPYEITSPGDAIKRGISVIYQEFNLNPYVSIYENIFLGKEFMKFGLVDHRKAKVEAQRYIDMIGLDANPSTLVSKLSIAQKQMVEIVKALSSDVKLLILDEPTATITDKETGRLFDIIRDLKKTGIGVIYISHRMNEIFEIGDRCTVMRDGKTIAVSDIRDTNVDQLTSLMVGRNVDFTKMNNPHINHEYEALRVENLNYKDKLKNINFMVRRGEIFGFAGLVGSGRTEIAKCILGAYKRDSGDIYLENGGKKLLSKTVSDVIDDGIVYLSEDRKDEGLILPLCISDNIALTNLDKLNGFANLTVDSKRMTSFAKSYMQKLRIKASSHLQAVINLSGGNQQKVVIAKWLFRGASIYIFDEPTRGIDVGARDEIYKIMYEIIADGASIIMISSDMPELLRLSDRIAIMCEGRLVAVLDNNEKLTQKEILKYALHGGEMLYG
jgi:ribose transport system ATP-binding protein